MLNRETAMRLLELGLDHSAADQTEIVLTDRAHGLTRLANGGIHQNVAVADHGARVRAVIGKRIGVATANRLTEDGLRALVDQAIAVARVSEPNPEFDSLPGPAEAPAAAATEPDPGEFTPERRAIAAETLARTGASLNLSAAGHVSTTMTAMGIGNSLGARAYHRFPHSSVMAIMTNGDASGYAAWDGRLLREAPVAAVADRASGICQVARHPQPAAPGRYTVILDPAAVAEMLFMLAIMGLGATPYQEGRSFMSGKLGRQLVGDNVTLHDDTYHPGMISLPFDFEGVPRQVVPLLQEGVAAGVVYDSLTAHKAGGGQRSTGHALPAPNTYGPLPLHLVLSPGNHTRDEMIREVERGILITRFHYVNIVHPRETTITGMTRDGTFLIENGVVTRPLQNLRFTQSILEALRRVRALEDRQHFVHMEGLFCLVPTLCVEQFTFTS